jgi:hypothetical protein
MILQNKVLNTLIKVLDMKNNREVCKHLHISDNAVFATDGKAMIVISRDEEIKGDFKKVDVKLLKSKMELYNVVNLTEIAEGESNLTVFSTYFKPNNSSILTIECETHNPLYYDAKILTKIQNVLIALGWKMDNLEVLSYNHKVKSISYRAKIDNYYVYFAICGGCFLNRK